MSCTTLDSDSTRTHTQFIYKNNLREALFKKTFYFLKYSLAVAAGISLYLFAPYYQYSTVIVVVTTINGLQHDNITEGFIDNLMFFLCQIFLYCVWLISIVIVKEGIQSDDQSTVNIFN
eukprot:Pgem_evm1s12949